MCAYPFHLVHRGRPRSGARVVEERESRRRDILGLEADADRGDVLDGGAEHGRVLAVEAGVVFGLA